MSIATGTPIKLSAKPRFVLPELDVPPTYGISPHLGQQSDLPATNLKPQVGHCQSFIPAMFFAAYE